MKKGFTLVEVLAVVILLGLISILAFPPILNSINKTKGQLSDASKKVLYSASELYVSNNLESYPNTNGLKYCLTIKELSDSGILSSKVYDVKGDEIAPETKISVDVVEGQYVYNLDNNCVPKVPYKEKSGANAPELLNNMVPIRYDEKDNKWYYADVTQEWYDYDKKHWANAVVLSNTAKLKKVGDVISETDIDLWYVWIPRFKYQLFSPTPINQLINVTFENGISTTGNVTCTDNISTKDESASEICNNDTPGNWYTHPAFTVNKGKKSQKEITGMWVGKFEVSDPTMVDASAGNVTISKIAIKPGVDSSRNKSITNFKNAIENISKKEQYDINGDSHIIRNMEWGAIAYLSQSKYGKGTTDISLNQSIYITGGGVDNAYKNNINQTTTQNIYGIYDMSGGCFEFVMGNIISSTGTFNPGSSDLETFPITNYDLYSYNVTETVLNGGKLGDATKETKGWFDDSADFPTLGLPWFERGGTHGSSIAGGVFNFTQYNGQIDYAVSTRAVLISNVS